MHKGIFIYGDGSNIFTLLGFLNGVREKIREVMVWNSCGVSALILFFKVLGYNYRQIFDLIKDFELISSMINGSSLLIEDESEKKNYIKNWLTFHLDQNGFLNTDSTLLEIFNRQKFFLNFMLWSKNKQDIITANANTNPDMTLVDCVMASLCGIGIYSQYTIDDNVFSNSLAINPVPVEKVFNSVDNIDIKTLYILNKKHYNFNFGKKFNSPLIQIENEILKQNNELNNYLVEKILKENNDEDFIKMYSYFSRGKIIIDEKETMYNLGSNQGNFIIQEKDTYDAYINHITYIENQS
tara:strand:- start:595 stop:1485 length:891 start_codon:yes stop_codon:yes gene_type:complete